MKQEKLLHQKGLKFSFLILRSLIISTILVATFSKFPIPLTLGWIDSGWEYRKPISVSNSGSALTDEDILIEVDTASLITAGKLQSDCDDLRFTDSDESTTLSYWVEGGCNTSTTQVWVQIPSLPSGGKTIYMYYGNSTASNASLSWSGNIIMYADTECPNGWTRAADLDGTFLLGATTYGTAGGSDTHSHIDISTTSSSISTSEIPGYADGETSATTATHTHTGLKASLNSSSSLPPYEETVLCYKNDFLISSGLISMFNTDTPSGWIRFSALDSLYIRANASFGTSGGSDTHTHSTTAEISTDIETGSSLVTTNPTMSATGGTITYADGYTIHKFTSSGTLTVSGSGNVEVLVVGGGGGGGYNSTYGHEGGGGAGGCLYNNSYSLAAGTYTVTVGSGGTANHNGQNSSISTLTAIGGGHGGARSGQTIYAQAGGSGGGGAYCCASECTGGAGTSGQGYAGGSSPGTYGAGGGGCGGVGASTRNGGAGATYSISGASICYGGGGASNDSGGTATCGGGSYGSNGQANTGGGGSGGNHPGGSGVVIVRYPTPLSPSGAIAALNHTHTIANTSVSSTSSLPSYVDMVFAKANSDQYVTSNNVVITTSLPPLGWGRFTALDEKLPRGAATYGATGGEATHTHTVEITTGIPSATTNAYGTGSIFADSTHTHSATATTDSASNLPKYTTVIYAQRKESIITTIGLEDTQNTSPDSPTVLQIESLDGSPTISDFAPELSAIFTDTDGDDTGNYYQIQVNTSSDFTGTTMWDSTKTALVPAVSNGGRSSEISYAGSELLSGATYYWRIKFWDSNTYNNESSWSTASQFTMNALPVASASNVSGTSDIYAAKPITIQAIYSDSDGVSNLDRLYLKIHNPSATTDIEYYIGATGTDQTGQYPTPVSGSEYISNITYDTQYNVPNSNDITVTWHITTNWSWTQTSELTYGVKALDHDGGSSEYAYTSTQYKYENQLTFIGDLSVKDSQNNDISATSWYPANKPMIISGVKVVYLGTIDLYPQDSQFDVKITNEEGTEWYDTTSSGEAISIDCTTPQDSNAEDTYTISIVNIPNSTSTSTRMFNIKVDADGPAISDISSTSHPDQSTWYESLSGDISWTIEDTFSGIYKSWRLIDQTQNQTIENISTNGTEISSTETYNFNIDQDGTWYIHIASTDNVGLSTIQTYKIQLDSQAPSFQSVSSTTHPVQTTWYSNRLATVNWVVEDTGSNISKVWAYPSSHSTEDTSTISSAGTEKSANDSFTMTDLNNGIWYLHLLAQDNTGKTSYTSYAIKIDSTTPDIVDITGNYEGILQNIDNGPVIAWTNSNSVSGNTYYITNDGTEPTSSNYIYSTTANTYNLPAQKEGQTNIKVRTINGAGTYSQTRTFSLLYDSIAPTNVSALKVETVETGIALSWKNPIDLDFNKVIIVKNDKHIPTSITDGTKIYEGTSTSYTDQNVSRESTYYYTIYAYDTVGNKSSGSTISSTPQEPTTGSKIVEVANLGEGKQISVSINNFTSATLTTNDIHVYSEQTIDITVPAKTITEEIANPSQVQLIIGGQTYNMSYDKETDTYKTKITSPSVKGAYDAQIQVTSATNQNELTLVMSVLVDPYGYIYTTSRDNEVRISNAKVSIYTKLNNEIVLWSPMSGETNPQYTNKQGEYQFFVQPGEYKLSVEASGYIPVETEWFTVETNIIEKNIEVKKNYTILYTVLVLVEISIGACLIVCLKKKKRNLKKKT